MLSCCSNEFLSKSLGPNIAETFLASINIQTLTKNALFEVISLLVPTGPHENLFESRNVK